ncbi:MAG: LPS export ABC transporter permease LptG [Wenzhouxiangellaceae bacterium]
MWGTARIDRAVGLTVWRSVVLVWLTLVAVYGLLEGVRELRLLSADYGGLDIFWYLLLTSPRRAYQVFPFAALMGAVLAVGGLAASGEMVAWRALGATRIRLLIPISGAVLSLLALIAISAEQWATQLELAARSYRLGRITGQVSLAGPEGLWLRDGENFVHIQYPLLDSALNADFHHVKIYLVDDNASLAGWIKADHASHQQNQWRLTRVQRVRLSDAGALSNQHQELTLPSQLDAGALGHTVLRPHLLAVADLHKLLAYFKTNSLDDIHYRAALWRRYYYPLVVWAAVLLALPFVMHMRGRESRTRALAIAVAVGLMWYVVERLTQGVVLAFRWSPAWGGAIPISIALLLSMMLFRRR